MRKLTYNEMLSLKSKKIILEFYYGKQRIWVVKTTNPIRTYYYAKNNNFKFSHMFVKQKFNDNFETIGYYAN